MIPREEIKKNAKKAILGKYGSAATASTVVAGCIFAQYIIIKGLSMIMYSDWGLLLGIIPGILLLPLYVGMAGFFLKIYQRDDRTSMKQVFAAGFAKNYRRNLTGMLIRAFKLFLWSIIGLVPLYFGLVLILMSSFQGNPMVTGHTDLNDMTYIIFFGTIIISIAGFIPYIMKAIAYSMTPYILAKDENILPSEAVKLSAAMTSGYKSEIFKLCISFAGWLILSVITLGIAGVLWTGPYMSASFAGIYEELKGNQLPK
ncbi:DUF975 family protein [Sedimentibacter hydroxybenzoicus DSM 7310]|uniref:DUF975 family protein n=1 Tax=Sedimentibacter hydroxybenzoicus DSM 7310 TaxID=1123245 RepID=A0A974BI71_SEDHY|nr:DUF975 family protein [Sedimentibacter hydroxybenzoicus]NYB73650.1 DUF975 family protein [Sedimentibacter hydroxybenzoicus DSM 7310]